MILTLINISFGIGEFFSTTFLILIILSFCAYLYRVSKYEKYQKFKYTIACLSIMLTLHLVVFPFLYILMLKNDPASFEFKTAIHDNRKKLVLNEWIDNSKSIPYEIKFLENLKLSNYSILNKQLKELKQLIFGQRNIIYTDYHLNLPSKTYDFTATVYIFDNKGILKKRLYKVGSQVELDSIKFGSVITEDINRLKNELKYYRDKKVELDRNNFWTFATLLPYSISSIFTGNMSPLTPMANILYTIHYVVIYCIGIGVFLHFLIMNLELIIRNKKS
ncbi:hypothetical protein [Chryseobacterium sp. BIGb0232]|uniref:hypothetical protein n=1 Tax=Chryseobacterium sp. BIGb0232 TaxID=2940598 RepID=UPI000F48D7DE|nr:hypothetical protein [Chryseobacterium sp. BIGb0232]MCS4301013.1 hypothetical protein [Chryseobacterium sp. BIGb0232]ROS20122.1 hypothetical protein EDF65_0824 [Chryseobacterium nakagawai]